MPTTNEITNEGASKSRVLKYGPICGSSLITNLNSGTQAKPTIMAAIAPFSLNLFQNFDNIIYKRVVVFFCDFFTYNSLGSFD